MTYLDTVLLDPLFSQLVIAGFIVFGVFGAWRFYSVYLLFVFVTFTDTDLMQSSMIILVVVMSFQYVITGFSSVFSNETKSPFKEVT